MSQDIPERRVVPTVDYRLFSRIVEQSPNSIVITDVAGMITYVNPRFSEVTGYKEEEARGQMIGFLKSGEHPPEFYSSLWEAIATGSEWRGELCSKKKDGSVFWEYSVISSLKDENGEITNFIAINTDITERKKTEEALRISAEKFRKLSITDSLTEMYNKTHFNAKLAMEISLANSNGQPLSVMMLDIDDFKNFNDTYGHLDGDQLLSQIGQLLKRFLQNEDTPCRFGGEEFVVILPMTTASQAYAIAERIREGFRKENIHTSLDTTVNSTLSIGVTEYRQHEDLEVFVHRADTNMYKSKHAGKNRVSCD